MAYIIFLLLLQPFTIFSFLHKTAVVHEYVNPCVPSPCGPNSQCREQNEQAICSCLPTYIGTPPACRPECVISSECPYDKACVNQKCVDPCPGVCGTNAQCHVRNHSPLCSCIQGYTGDPFIRCSPIPRKPLSCQAKYCSAYVTIVFVAPPPPVQLEEYHNPCVPSPCGLNAVCRDVNGSPSCSCLPTYIGSPPNCHPECTINAECPSNKACIREKCQDPCPGSCGFRAICTVINHTPSCTCPSGYTGDPFTICNVAPPPPRKLRTTP